MTMRATPLPITVPRFGVEATVTIGRENAIFFVEIAASQGRFDASAAEQCHVTLTAEHALKGEMSGNA